MRTKFITSFMLALVCGLPITAKVYTIQSLLGDLVVNVHVDKSITWAVTKGKTQVLQPSVISLQTDKQTFGVNPKVHKASVTNWKTMIMVVISDCSFPAMGTMWNSGPS